MKSHLFRTVGVAAALLTAGAAAAQVPLTPRALGMGGAYVAVARGHETLFLNPANLGLPGTPHWSVALPQVSLGGTVLGPSVGDLPDIFDYDNLTQSRRDELLASIPASGTELRYDLRAPVFALQTGHFALGASYGSIGQHTVSRDLVELLFNGYEEGRTDYRAGNTRGSRITFWDFAAAYGRSFGPLSIGVTAHYIRGGAVLQSRLFEPRIDVERQDIEIEYRSVLSRGGSGYGVDLGAAYQPVPGLTLSGAVSNLYSRMDWSETLRTRSLILNRRDIENEGGAALLDRYESSEQDVDPDAAPLSVYATAEGLYDDAFFPAIARVGAAWQARTGTELAVSYQNRLTEGRMADDWEQMVGLGVQQRIPVVTLRAGFATNLDGSTLLSGGLSLGPLQLGLARLNEGELEGASRSGWVGSFGLSVKTSGTIN